MIWSVPRDWVGETAFIVAGGPSVKGWPEGKDRKGRPYPALAGQNLGLLKGRRIILVNSAYETLPDADFLFFADHRWWGWHERAMKAFKGRIVTTSKVVTSDRVLTLQKLKPPPALAGKPTHLAMQRTSLQGAINLAVHLGAARIVLLGADMQAAPNGRTHHHRPHPKPQKPGCWDKQMAQLRELAPALAERGIEVVNCSPHSRIDWWPKRPLEDFL